MAQVLKQISRQATIPLYSLPLDTHLQKMTGLAGWVFYSQEMPKVKNQEKG